MATKKSPTPRSARARRLVASRLGTLPPGDHTDPASQGLQLCVRAGPRGTNRAWLFQYTWRGAWVRMTIGHYPGTDLVDARDIAQQMRRRIDDGIDPSRARPKRTPKPPPLPASAGLGADAWHTIEFLASEFMERHIKGKRKRPEYVQRILDKDVLPVWAGRDVRSIEPHEVIDLLDKIVDRGSPVQANRVAGVLTQLFKLGVLSRIVSTSPVLLLYRPGGKEKPRDRALSDKELAAFLSDPKKATRFERLSQVLMILLLTGQRRGSDDGKEAINPKLITRGVARCQERMEKLGIAKFSANDLRRTVRTGLARLKIAPHIAERVLNHAQERIPGTYDVHDYLEEKREALEKWAEWLRQLAVAGT